MSKFSVTTSPPLEVIDLHSHFAGPRFDADASRGTSPAQKEFWDKVSHRPTSTDALIASIASGISGRAINASLEFLRRPGEDVALDTVRMVNDSIAALTTRHPAVLYGPATVNAHGGEASAQESVLAAKELGLRAVFESAKGRSEEVTA